VHNSIASEKLTIADYREHRQILFVCPRN